MFNTLLQVWFEDVAVARGPGAFRFRRSEFKVSGPVKDGWAWWTVFDPMAAPNLKEGVIALTPPGASAGCRIQVGRFKHAFGAEGLVPSGQLDAVERPMMNTRLRWSEVRDFGAQASSAWELVTFAAGVFDGVGQGALAAKRKAVVVRAAAGPVAGLTWGAAWRNDRPGPLGEPNGQAGVELGWTVKAAGRTCAVRGEAVEGKTVTGAAVDSRTWFATLVAEILPGSLEAVVRGDWLDPDAKQLKDRRAETTVGLNQYLAARKVKLQANYVVVKDENPAGRGDILRLNFQTTF